MFASCLVCLMQLLNGQPKKITCSLSFRKSGLNPGSLYVKNVATDSISNELNNPRNYKLIKHNFKKSSHIGAVSAGSLMSRPRVCLT